MPIAAGKQSVGVWLLELIMVIVQCSSFLLGYFWGLCVWGFLFLFIFCFFLFLFVCFLEGLGWGEVAQRATSPQPNLPLLFFFTAIAFCFCFLDCLGRSVA